MRLHEANNHGLDVIDIQDDNSSISGYVVDISAPQVQNWIDKNSVPAKFLTYVKKYNRISFLNNLWVEEDDRNQGIGSALVDNFIGEASFLKAESIFLIADTGETQDEGMDLVAWYKDIGFKVIANTSGGPLMELQDLA